MLEWARKKSILRSGPLLLIIWLITLFLVWPLPNKIARPEEKTPIEIVDRNGKWLYTVRQKNFGEQDHLKIAKIPQGMLRILLLVEDESFYRHYGISLKGILRALWQNHQAGKVVSGGSTITQQLIRNRLQPDRRDYGYKIREIVLALKLETRLSKNEILEAYLNSVYFGHQAYGIQAAAKTYFNKNAMELSIGESAFLIGLLQSPTAYDPFVNLEAAKTRYKRVLGMLKKNNSFSEDDLSEMEYQQFRLSSGKTDIRAPHFVMWVLGTHSARPPVGTRHAWSLQGGARNASTIQTTLDLDLQSETERIVQNHLKKLQEKNVTAAAVVVLDAGTGEVLSMVGSGDYFDAERSGAVNVALSDRQPGSTLKPFTYALALKAGDTVATTVADIESQFFTQEGNPYLPRNYDYGYHGLVRYREALANSYNIAAVKVLRKVGVGTLIDVLKKAGITTLEKSPDHYGLALTLGSGEVKLIELTAAYGMLARGGISLPIKRKIDEEVPEGQRILDEKTAWLISDILSDDKARRPEFGENGPLNFDFPVAAKTGTTRNSRDNWTIGYTPERVVGVWVGNADNSAMKGTSGITGAGPIFHDVMIAATKNIQKSGFHRPEGILNREICTLSGKLPTPDCPQTMREWFIENNVPKEKDDLFVPFLIDTRNGLVANEFCPERYTVKKIFVVFPPELRRWGRENGWPEMPTQNSPLCPTAGLPDEAHQGEVWLKIIKPHPRESFLLDPLVPDKNEKIIFEASAGSDIQKINWFVNGQKVGVGKKPDFHFEWAPKAGDFTIEGKNGNQSDEVMIEVLDSMKKN